MAIVTIQTDYHNPSNPKCISCVHYTISSGNWLSGKCASTENKVKTHNRYHNSKGCSFHRYRKQEDLMEIVEEQKSKS